MTIERCPVNEPEDLSDLALFMATDGLTRCPVCGRYARAEELASLGNHEFDTVYRRAELCPECMAKEFTAYASSPVSMFDDWAAARKGWRKP